MSAAAVAVSLALTGCASAPVASPNGEGLCDTDPVSLSVSQDTVGNNIQIDYVGPSDVSLLVNPFSFYFDFEDYLDSLEPDEDLTVTLEDGGPVIAKVDPTDSGWTVSSVAGGLVSWAFDGNVEQLMSALPAGYGDPAELFFPMAFPISIAVSCDETLTSTPDYNDGDSSDSFVEDLDIAVAQSLYPRHSTIDTVDITGQEVVDGNLVVDFEFAGGTADRFYDFALGGGFVMIVPVTLPPGTPEISNDTFDGLWFNFVESCRAVTPSAAYCNSSSEFGSWSIDGTNEWTIPGATDLIDGEYLGVFFLADAEDNPTDVRFAFTSFTYDSVNGFSIQDLATQPREDDEKLAPTGGDPNVIIFGVVGLLVVMAAVALRPRRREARIEK